MAHHPATKKIKKRKTKMNIDPFLCPGCHSGDFAGFDHFCDKLNISDNELGPAFSIWLEGRYDVAIERYGEVKP